MIKTISRVKEILDIFNKARIAVIGDLILDVHVSGKAERISQEAPVPIVRAKQVNCSLGGAANVMKNLSVYGTKVHAFGIVGADADGDKLLQLLDKTNIEHKGIVRTENRRTTRKERVIANSQQLLRIDYEETLQIEERFTKDIMKKLADLLKNHRVNAIIVEDYAKGLLSKEMLSQIVSLAKKYKILCALDPHPSHPFNVKGISFMTPNRSEALALAGINPNHELDKYPPEKLLARTASILMKNWKPDELIITLGADGMALFKDKLTKPHMIPTKAKEVFDVSGAGDTVIALYTLAKIAGANSEESAEIANHAAGVVVGKIGTATASRDEIIESFKSEGLN